MSHDSSQVAYSIQQFCAKTDLSRSTIERLILSGQIVGRKVGRKFLIPHTSLEAFLRRDHHVPTNEEVRALRAARRAKKSDSDKPSPRSAPSQNRRGAR